MDIDLLTTRPAKHGQQQKTLHNWQHGQLTYAWLVPFKNCTPLVDAAAITRKSNELINVTWCYDDTVPRIKLKKTSSEASDHVAG